MCAAGLAGSTADDVAKEVAIYRAHKATPIVIATEGEERFAGAGDDRRCRRSTRRSRSCCRRWSGTCSATRRRWPSTPRPARCARPWRPSSGPRAPSVVGRRRARSRARAASPARPTGSSTACAAHRYDGHLEASTAVRLAALLRYALRRPPARGVPGRARQGRHAGGAGRRPRARADPRHRGADPARSTPSSTRPRPSPSASPAATRACWTGRSCRPCSPPAPAATCSATARSRRSPTSTRPSPRSPASPATASTGDTHHASSTAAASRASSPSRAERNPALRGTKHRVASEREVLVARGRSDGRTVIFVPEVKAQHGDRHHAAARALPRPPRRGRRCAACSTATTGATTASSTRSPRPRPPSTTTCSAELPVDRPADRAGHRDRRPLARRVSCGDDRDRHRRRRRSTRFRLLAGRARRRCATRLFTADELAYVAPEGRPGAVARRPLRGHGGGDEGARRRPRRVRLPRGVGRGRAVRRAARSSSPARARALAADRGVARWHLSLTHTGRSPSPWSVAE